MASECTLSSSSACSKAKVDPVRAQMCQAVSPVPAQMWTEEQSRRRCGRGEPSPGADVAAASPVANEYAQQCLHMLRVSLQ